MDRALKKAEGRNPKAERRPKPEARKQDPKATRPPNRAGPTGDSHAPHLKHRRAPLLVEAVTFDVGGTLIECWPSVGHVYAEVAARHGHPGLSPSVLNRRFQAAWRAFEGFRHTRDDWSALVDVTFRGLVEPLPSQTFFPDLFNRFSELDAWHIFDDVIPALEALKSKRLKLGIISNWDDRLRPLLRRLELHGYFDGIVVSCELGARKPARALFVAACAGLGSAPEHTLHVGDSLEMDLEGARAAGLLGLRLKRNGRRRSPADIGSLLELDKL